MNRNAIHATTKSTSPPTVSCVPRLRTCLRVRERDGERWREMERDGERWREMERDGERWMLWMPTVDPSSSSSSSSSSTYSSTGSLALRDTVLTPFLSDPSLPSPLGRVDPPSTVPFDQPVSAAGLSSPEISLGFPTDCCRLSAGEIPWLRDVPPPGPRRLIHSLG